MTVNKFKSIISEYTDKYNPNKIWIIKMTSCGHYYYNQKINNKMFYGKFHKTTIKFLKSISGINDLNKPDKTETIY